MACLEQTQETQIFVMSYLKYTSSCNAANVKFSHVKQIPCYHSMTQPLITDGRDSLQIWRRAVNKLNKQLQTINKR
jgi:hypothetical protein